MKNSKIVDAYNKIELDEFSRQKIYSKIKEKAYSNKKDYKKKVWNYKKISSIVAVCACAIMVFKIPGVQASLQNTINKFASWISGNSKDDYYEEIDSSVGNNGFKLKIINAQRRYEEVKIRYEIEFPVNLENFVDINVYYNYKRDTNKPKKNNSKNEMIDSELFASRNIYINGVSYDYIKSVDYKFDAGISYVSVENIKLIKNKLVQELVIIPQEEHTKDDINIKLEFNKFKICNEEYEVNLKQEYTLKGKQDLNNKIEIIPIDYSVKIDEKNKLDFYGYSYTKTGIKLYSKFTGEEDFMRIIKLIVEDDAGTLYLMYPWWTNQKYLNDEVNNESVSDGNEDNLIKNDILVFELYDGVAAEKIWGYQMYWNDNIKNLNINVFVENEYDIYIPINEEYDNFDPIINFVPIDLEKEFKINFEEKKLF